MYLYIMEQLQLYSPTVITGSLRGTVLLLWPPGDWGPKKKVTIGCELHESVVVPPTSHPTLQQSWTVEPH